MRTNERVGGIAALVAAGTFVVGLGMFATILIDYTTATDPADAVAFLAENRLALTVWNLIITIVFGIALVPLVLALHDRLQSVAPGLSRTACAFGLIWAGLIIATGMIVNVGFGTVLELRGDDPVAAATVWAAVDTVTNGLGGGNEVVGGVWVLLVSLAALGTGLLPAWLNWLGVVAGAAGLVTVLPGLEPVGAIFGLGLIVWFVGVGAAMVCGASMDAGGRARGRKHRHHLASDGVTAVARSSRGGSAHGDTWIVEPGKWSRAWLWSRAARWWADRSMSRRFWTHILGITVPTASL